MASAVINAVKLNQYIFNQPNKIFENLNHLSYKVKKHENNASFLVVTYGTGTGREILS